jgi:2-haloacid dehalogenase
MFDLGGVLIDWNPRLLYRKVFAREAEMEHFLAEVCHGQWNWEIDAGKPFEQAIRERQGEVPEYKEQIGLWFTRWEEMLGDELPGTVAVLRELKAQDVPLFALTNWYRETFPRAKARFDFLGWFRDILVSGEERVAKPDPAIFHLATRRFGLVPAETVYIDDHRPNIDSALKLGFDAIHFTGAPALRQALVERGVLAR